MHIFAWTISFYRLLTVLIYDTPHCYRIFACTSENWREQGYVLDYSHIIQDSFFEDTKTIPDNASLSFLFSPETDVLVQTFSQSTDVVVVNSVVVLKFPNTG